MSSLTAWVMTGRVMIRVTSSTSMTSMSGVVLMSHISSPPPPTFIDMYWLLKTSAGTAHAVVRLGEEPDLDDAAALDRVHDAPDELVAGVLVRANMDLGLRHPHRGLLDVAEQHVAVRHRLIVPVDVAFLVHRDRDVFRLGLCRDIDGLRQIHRNGLRDHGDRDQEDDEQH